MMIEEIGFVVIEEPYHIYVGSYSVEVEYIVLVCNHNYSLCVVHIGVVISRVYVLASIISVCDLRVLGGEQPQ